MKKTFPTVKFNAVFYFKANRKQALYGLFSLVMWGNFPGVI